MIPQLTLQLAEHHIVQLTEIFLLAYLFIYYCYYYHRLSNNTALFSTLLLQQEQITGLLLIAYYPCGHDLVICTCAL